MANCNCRTINVLYNTSASDPCGAISAVNCDGSSYNKCFKPLEQDTICYRDGSLSFGGDTEAWATWGWGDCFDCLCSSINTEFSGGNFTKKKSFAASGQGVIKIVFTAEKIPDRFVFSKNGFVLADTGCITCDTSEKLVCGQVTYALPGAPFLFDHAYYDYNFYSYSINVAEGDVVDIEAIGACSPCFSSTYWSVAATCFPAVTTIPIPKSIVTKDNAIVEQTTVVPAVPYVEPVAEVAAPPKGPIVIPDIFSKISFVKKNLTAFAPTPSSSPIPSVSSSYNHEYCAACTASPTVSSSVTPTNSRTPSFSRTPSESMTQTRSVTVSRSVYPVVTPFNLAATKGFYTDKVAVSWSGATGSNVFQLFRFTTNSDELLPINDWQATTSYDDYDVVYGTTYYYIAVAASDDEGNGESIYSNIDEGWIALPPSVSPSITVSSSVTSSISITPSSTPSYSVSPSEGFVYSGSPSVTVSRTRSRTQTISATITKSISISITRTLSVSVTPSVSVSISIGVCAYSFPFFLKNTICYGGVCKITTGFINILRNGCAALTLDTNDYTWDIEVTDQYGSTTYPGINPIHIQGTADNVVLFSTDVVETCVLSNVSKRLYYKGVLIWEQSFVDYNTRCYYDYLFPQTTPCCDPSPSLTPSPSLSPVSPSVTVSTSRYYCDCYSDTIIYDVASGPCGTVEAVLCDGTPYSICLNPQEETTICYRVGTLVLDSEDYSVIGDTVCSTWPCGGSVSPTRSVTPSISPSITVSSSTTPSITVSISVSPSITITGSITSSESPSVTVSLTIQASPSLTPSETPTITVSSSISPTITVSITVSSSITPTITLSISRSVSKSPVDPSVSRTVTVSTSITVTISISPSITPSQTVSITVSPSITVSISVTPSDGISLSPSPSITVTPVSVTASPSITTSISVSPSLTVSPSLQTCDCYTITILYNTSSPDPCGAVTAVLCDGTPYDKCFGPVEEDTLCFRANSLVLGGDTEAWVYWDYNLCGTWNCGQAPSPSVSPTVSVSGTPSITGSITVSITVSPSITGSITVSASITPTITVSRSRTPSITRSETRSESRTPSVSLTPVSESRTPSITPTPSRSPVSISRTPSITPTPSLTPVSISRTPSITPTPSRSPVSVSRTPSITPTPSRSPVSVSRTPSPSRSFPSESRTPSMTPDPPSITPSRTPSTSPPAVCSCITYSVTCENYTCSLDGYNCDGTNYHLSMNQNDNVVVCLQQDSIQSQFQFTIGSLSGCGSGPCGG